jgi:hypothetical protein
MADTVKVALQSQSEQFGKVPGRAVQCACDDIVLEMVIHVVDAANTTVIQGDKEGGGVQGADSLLADLGVCSCIVRRVPYLCELHPSYTNVETSLESLPFRKLPWVAMAKEDGRERRDAPPHALEQCERLLSG